MSVRLANSTRTPPNSLLAEEKEELGFNKIVRPTF